MSEEDSTEETPTMVSMPAEQFSEMMRMMQELSQKADVLQGELDALKVERGSVSELVDQGDRQEAVMHTIRRASQSREMFKQQRLDEALQYVELAVDAAILDYKQNPPKHRR